MQPIEPGTTGGVRRVLWLVDALVLLFTYMTYTIGRLQLVRRLEVEAGGRLPVQKSLVRAELDAALLAMGVPSLCTYTAPKPACLRWACAVRTCVAWARHMQLKTP